VLAVPGHIVFAAYPLVPWIGVTAVGFVLGQIYGWPEQKRKAWLTRAGAGLTFAFLVCAPSIVTEIRSPGACRHPWDTPSFPS
jgi:uncharacterized membrane protein